MISTHGTLKKQSLEESTHVTYPKEREVWICVLGKNLGQEQNGSGDTFTRPCLIVKKFTNKLFWVIPLTSKQKPIDYFYNFTDPEGREVAAILAQINNSMRPLLSGCISFFSYLPFCCILSGNVVEFEKCDEDVWGACDLEWGDFRFGAGPEGGARGSQWLREDDPTQDYRSGNSRR
jgi:hypothetical protein